MVPPWELHSSENLAPILAVSPPKIPIASMFAVAREFTIGSDFDYSDLRLQINCIY